MVQAFDPEGNLLLFFGGANPEPHGLGMPAGVTIDRSTLPAFRKYLAKDFEPKYLFFVANQFGKNKIGVYAFGRSSTADYPPTTRPATTRPATQPATTRPGAKIESK